MLEIILPALIGAFASLLIVVVKDRLEQGKEDAEIEKLGAESIGEISGATVLLLGPMRQRITDLEAASKERNAQIEAQDKRIQDLEQKVEEWEQHYMVLLNGAARLHHQVRSLGKKPVFDVPVYEPLEGRRASPTSSSSGHNPVRRTRKRADKQVHSSDSGDTS